MSQDFNPLLVVDDRLNVSSTVDFAVFKGASQNTPQKYDAISSSNTSHTFNLQIPSENICIDREILWSSSVRLKFTSPAGANAVPNGVVCMNYGYSDALSAFPLHQLCSVQSVSINNNTVSLNTRDILPFFNLVNNDKRNLARYKSLCPTMPDNYAYYADAVGANNNPLGSYKNVGDNDLLPRGAFPILKAYGGTPQAPTALPVGDGASALTWYVEFRSVEALMISPFIWSNPHLKASMYGIQNMNMVFNIGDASRVWRSANPWLSSIGSVSIDEFMSSTLILNQLSPHPSQLMPSRNTVPYASYPRYITQINTQIQPLFGTDTAGNKILLETQGTKLSSTNIQLSMIPDYVCIFVRRPLNQQTNTTSDSFLTIKGISIQFNNQSGILSTASPYTLYEMSVDAGSSQNWENFSGVAMGANGEYLPSTGTMLLLEFGKAIAINDDYYAPNSLGNFQFQFDLSVANQFEGADLTNTNWEIVLITANSGVFVNERGTSSTFQGILTRQTVLDVSSKEPVSSTQLKRLVGGGFFDTLRSVSGKAFNLGKKYLPKVAPIVKEGLRMLDHPHAEKGANVLEALGYGRSGGGSSGGRKKLDAKLL